MLRAFAESEGAEHTASVAPAAAATTVMPHGAATQALSGPTETALMQPARVPAPVAPRRRRPAPVVIVTALLIAAAVVVAVVIVTQRNTSTSGTSVKHGTPTLQQPLERDVRRLENLVHR
jgi:hypothetical protein